MSTPLFPAIPWKDADGWHVVGGPNGGQFVASMATEAEAVAYATEMNSALEEI
jgi:hypothetical protein